jgi:CheY-like chemotaxis protein
VSTGKKALVVDDDDPIRAMLAKVVERQDVEVDTARDGVEAIEKIDVGNYDLVVLDLMMPRIDGYGVLKHIRQRRPELLKCTIIASAVPETEILRRFDVPVYRIHPKPFDMSRLIQDIRICTGQAEAESA